MPELAVSNPNMPRVRTDLGELITKFIGLFPRCEKCGRDAKGNVEGRRVSGQMFYTSLCPACSPPHQSSVEVRRSPGPTNADLRRRLRDRERLHNHY